MSQAYPPNTSVGEAAEAINAPMLHNVYNFEDFACCNDQDTAYCNQLWSNLLKSTKKTCKELRKQGSMGLLFAQGQTGRFGEAIGFMDHHTTHWFPAYGAAIVSLNLKRGHESDFKAGPSYVQVHIVCLQHWENYVHRCTNSGELTQTAVCTDATLAPVLSPRFDEQNSSKLIDGVKHLLQDLRAPGKKKHFTAGYLRLMAFKVSEEISKNPDLPAADIVSNLKQSAPNLAELGDGGGFRDVGKHSGCTKLATCWPLVEHVFRFIAQQGRRLDPDAVIAFYHHANSKLLCTCAAREPSHTSLSRAWLALKAASASTVSVCHKRSELPAVLNGILAGCRQELDDVMGRLQAQTLEPVVSGKLDYASERALCRPFAVNLPPASSSHAHQHLDVRGLARSNLRPVCELSEDTLRSASALCAWANALPGCPSAGLLTLCLHQIERWFFCAATRCLGHGQEVESARDARELAVVYSEKLDYYEAKSFATTSDEHGATLSVELRSRETLVIWIALCLAHQQTVTEWPQVPVRAFALPVNPDDLWCLVLSSKPAVDAVKAVAMYIGNVNCNSSQGDMFAEPFDPTLELASLVASQIPECVQMLHREEAIAQVRIQLHWEEVLRKQELVRTLEQKVDDATGAVRQALTAVSEARQAYEERMEPEQMAVDKLRQQYDSIYQAQVEKLHQRRVPRNGKKNAEARAHDDPFVASANRALEDAEQKLLELEATVPEKYALDDATSAQAEAWEVCRKLQAELGNARVAPPEVRHALPDSSADADNKKAALAILFFLREDLTMTFPILGQLIWAAQQAIIAWPLRDTKGQWDISATVKTEAHEQPTWLQQYIKAHKSASFKPQQSTLNQKTDDLQNEQELTLQTTFASPQDSSFGAEDVTAYRTKSDGVWYPPKDCMRLVWRGGPMARYNGACESYLVMNPFAARQSVSAAIAYSEPGRYRKWLATVASGPSKLCATRSSQPSPSCMQRCSKTGTICSNCPPVYDRKRGNLILTEQETRPPSMSCDEWLSFAALRAYPCRQIRALSVALQTQTLALSTPQTCAAVRMVLYQIGQLEYQVGGEGWGRVVQMWHCDYEILDLHKVLMETHERIKHAPTFLLQAPLLCEIAVFLNERLSAEPAADFMTMAEGWAASFQDEMVALEQSPSKANVDKRQALKAKCAIAQGLAVMCFGWSTSFYSEDKPEVSMRKAKRLCANLVQAHSNAQASCSGPLQACLQAILKQCSKVMACHIFGLVAAVKCDGKILSQALQNVFSQLPEDVLWEETNGLGCFMAKHGDCIYSVNLFTGTVLCNGHPPSHLPRVITDHPTYQRVFGDSVFEVQLEFHGFVTLYKTARSINGRFYSWRMNANQDDVVIKEYFPHETSAGNEKLDVLELLPYECGWAPHLPKRLKHMYSHWMCRERNAILLRGTSYSSQSVSYVLLYSGFKFGSTCYECLVVPLQDQDTTWTKLVYKMVNKPAERCKLDRMWHVSGSSAVMRLLQQVEDPELIHVSTTRSSMSDHSSEAEHLSFTLPRFNLQFELHEGSNVLESRSYRGFHVPPSALSLRQGTGHAPVVPTGLQGFLILCNRKRAAVKVVIPDGRVEMFDGKLSIRKTTNFTTDLEHHAFTRNIRTHHLDTKVMQSRLLMAALFAAADGGVIPQLGMTGGEHALQMLRQCSVNRPLTPPEAEKLEDLVRFADHTPALRMLCAAFHDHSRSLAFLHPGSEAIPLATLSPGQNAMVMYEHELHQSRARKGIANVRRLLTDDECSEFACLPPWPFDSCRDALWQDIDGLMDDKCRAFLERAQNGAFHAQVQNCLRVEPMYSVSGSEGHDLKLDLSLLDASAQGREVAQDHHDSMNALLAWPPEQAASDVDLKSVQHTLEQLHEDLTDGMKLLENFLLKALAFVPNTSSGQAMRSMRAAGVLATPAVADLICVPLPRCSSLLQGLNPQLDDDAQRSLLRYSLLWQQLCVLQDKITRCIARCKDSRSVEGAMDTSVSALAQDLRNSRQWDVETHPEWLAFEVLNGIEIRQRQYVVAKHMLENQGGPGMGEESSRGAILQLNMGEGKTRVILPMLVLAMCGKGEVVRLGFLGQLLPEAVDHLHACLTGSLLQVKLLTMPFCRDFQLDSASLNAMIWQYTSCMHSNAFLCWSREHYLSLLLKAQEMHTEQSDVLHTTIKHLISMPTVDVLDECDELLSHKFQLVYAWGAQNPLPARKARVVAIQAVLEVLARDKDVRKMLDDDSICQVDESSGRFGALDTVRLVPGSSLQKCLPSIRRTICKALFVQEYVKIPPLRWLSKLPMDRLETFQQCCLDQTVSIVSAAAHLGVEEGSHEMDQLWALRGLLGFQVMENCLQKRHRVDYGLDLDVRKGTRETKMAVPYRACDTPSDRAEYKHPEVSIIKTHLAYYQGLTPAQVQEAVEALMLLPQSRQEAIYKSIMKETYREGKESLSDEDMQKISSFNKLSKIDLSYGVQLEVLHKYLQHNFRLVNFWLEECVLPKETRNFPENLRCTAWHMAASASGKVVGFSGTNDNRSLLPLLVKAQDTVDTSIKGTNGRMVSVLLRPGKSEFFHLKATREHNKSIRMGRTRVGEQVLNSAVDMGTDVLIDSGAQLAGMEPYETARYLVESLQQLAKRPTASLKPSRHAMKKGVVFYMSSPTVLKAGGSPAGAGWYVMDMKLNVVRKDRSPIEEADTFVLFDEAHCRGSDMQLQKQAKAVLTLGPSMARDTFMQAAARMRQLEKEQTLVILGTDEICRSICETCGVTDPSAIHTENVIQWILFNTAEANSKGLLEYFHQGKHFAASIGKDIFTDEESAALDALYGESEASGCLQEFINKPLQKNGCDVELSTSGRACIERLCEHAQKYGDRIDLVTSATEECERELEQLQELEQEQETQKQFPAVSGRAEKDWANVSEAIQEDFHHFVSRQGIPIHDMRYLVSLLPDSSPATTLNWPGNLAATENFAFCTTPSTEPAAAAALVRKADAMLAFRDGSGLLISEREAEKVICAIRAAPPSKMSVWLVHVAFCKAAGPAVGRGVPPRFMAPSPYRDASGHPGATAQTWLVLPHAYTAAALFNGEADFKMDHHTPEERKEALRVVQNLVFGHRHDSRRLSGQDGRVAVEQLLLAREKGTRWPCSSMEIICTHLIQWERTHALQKGPR